MAVTETYNTAVTADRGMFPHSSLRAVAEDYARHHVSTAVAFPQSKVPAVPWAAFANETSTEYERDAMYSHDFGLNIGAVCGVASLNLAMVDAESPDVFIDQVNRFDKAGKGETWIMESFRGGHITIRLPFPVAGYKADGYEVRGQGQFVLLPPSIHPSGKQYTFLHRPPTIIEVKAEDLPWLKLEPANPKKQIPRRAFQLLNGERVNRYDSRSDAEQAIILSLVNKAYTFEEILGLFRAYPAAGKFAERDAIDPQSAITWLWTSFEAARRYCVEDSPARQAVRALRIQAESVPWKGHHGSVNRAVYLAHTTIAHQAGSDHYHASVRELAEHAGCTAVTASRATRRLRTAGLLRLVEGSKHTFASRYNLQLPGRLKQEPQQGNREDRYTPSQGFNKTVSMLPFFLPDCFRCRGLGRSAYEVFEVLKPAFLSVREIVEKTGRSDKTVRKSLHRMADLEFVSKEGKKWRGREVSDADMKNAAQRLGTHGAAERQKKRHRADRLRHTLRSRLRGMERAPRSSDDRKVGGITQ